MIQLIAVLTFVVNNAQVCSEHLVAFKAGRLGRGSAHRHATAVMIYSNVDADQQSVAQRRRPMLSRVVSDSGAGGESTPTGGWLNDVLGVLGVPVLRGRFLLRCLASTCSVGDMT